MRFLNDDLPNLPPNSCRASAESKREKVYYDFVTCFSISSLNIAIW